MSGSGGKVESTKNSACPPFYLISSLSFLTSADASYVYYIQSPLPKIIKLEQKYSSFKLIKPKSPIGHHHHSPFITAKQHDPKSGVFFSITIHREYLLDLRSCVG